MIKLIKDFSLLLYFMVALSFMEFLLRLATSTYFFSHGLFISLLFSLALAILFFIITSFFQGKANHILSFILLALAGFLYTSQLIYYQFFRTFYSIYSAGNVSQVFEFWKDTLLLIVQNLFWLILFFVPAILILVLGKKVLTFIKISALHRKMLVFCIIFIHILGLASIHIGSKDLNSAYYYYYKNSNPVLSIEKLGLITTMRLDFQRQFLGWSPSWEVPVVPAYSPSQNNLEELNDTNDVGNLSDVSNKNLIEEEEKIEYNILDIDFDELISNEDDKKIREMHNYFSGLVPTMKNEYTGKYRGYNLIQIIAESFSPYAVREDITPTLYKMVHEGYNFTNFYVPSWDVSTSDGEYVALTSLLPKSGVWSFTKAAKIYLPFVLGNQLKALDYKTVAYHNHTYTYYNRDISHPNLGYDYKGVGNGLNLKSVWPASDLEMMTKTIPEYINIEPFHTYYLTVSGHMQYSFVGNSMAFENKQFVESLPYTEQGKAYLAAQIELDKALKHLLDKLEEAGIANRTLIALSADHYPYGLNNKTIDELAGHKLERNFELYKSSFILYTKGMEPITIDKPSSNLDVLPTLSNLLGIEYDSRLLMGKDIFSNSEPLVIFRNRSFITDKGKYNSLTKEFIPNVEEDISEDYLNWISSIVENKFFHSAKILESNYYDKLKLKR